MSAPKPYRVRCTDRVVRAITITAPSADDAIHYASTLLRIHGGVAFDVIGEADPDDWEAEPLDQSDDRFALIEAIERLLAAPDLNLDSLDRETQRAVKGASATLTLMKNKVV